MHFKIQENTYNKNNYKKFHFFLNYPFTFPATSAIIHFVDGVWRSLVARTAGGREVAGSNPVAPIFPLKVRVFKSMSNTYFDTF